MEAGQLAFVAVVLAAAFVGRKLMLALGGVTPAIRHATHTVAGYVVGGIATYWLAERLAGF